MLWREFHLLLFSFFLMIFPTNSKIGYLEASSSVDSFTQDPLDKLPEHPSKFLLLAHCSGCHSLHLVIDNRMSRTAWDETIAWMEKTQNLNSLDITSRKAILDYLEAFYSPKDYKNQYTLIKYITNPLPK